MVETVRNSAPGRVIQRLFDDRIGTLASLVAWGTLNTLLPLILGVLALAYMIRARDEARVITPIEQHLDASYARVLASYPDKAPELRLLR